MSEPVSERMKVLLGRMQAKQSQSGEDDEVVYSASKSPGEFKKVKKVKVIMFPDKQSRGG